MKTLIDYRFEKDRTLIIKFNTNILSTTVDEIRWELDYIPRDSISRLKLDMMNVTMIDSLGLNLLVSITKTFGLYEIHAYIKDKIVRNILTVVRLSDTIIIHEDFN